MMINHDMMFEPNRTAINEPAMVMGFIPTEMHDQLRRMAAERGCSESALVSDFIKKAMTAPLLAIAHKRLAPEPQ